VIAVTGATGKLGRLVVGGLLEQLPAAGIAALARDPAKAADLARRGVQVRAADYDRPDTLDAALEGASRVLLISGNDPVRAASQHAAVIDAAKRAGAGLLVYTSLRGADTSSLATAVPHRQTEPALRSCGVPYSLLRNALYTDHYADQVRLAARSGIFVGSAGQGRVASATRADLAAAAVAVLTGAGHENTVYELTGDTAWSYPELTGALARLTGRRVAYESLSTARHREFLVATGLPAPFADAYVDLYAAIARGELAETTGDLRALIGRPATTLDDALASFLTPLTPPDHAPAHKPPPPPIPPPEERIMQLTWLGHSTFRLEKDGFVAVVDPGLVAPDTALDDADAVLITHEHGDHFLPSLIAKRIAAKPRLPIWTNRDVAALLAGSGAKVHVIGDGDAFDVGGITVHAHGEWHAPIHPDVRRVRNTGFLFEHRVFHPGDAYTDPHAPVDLLFVPEFGLYTRPGYALDFIRRLKPKQASPVHDTGLDPTGRGGIDGFLVQNPTPPFAPGTGSPFVRLTKFEPIEA